jgi:hypothetical protein
MNQSSAGSLQAFSLMRGGPFDRFERAIGLVRGDRGDLLRQTLFIYLVAWLPLRVIAAERWIISREVDPLIFDLGAHARPLLAAPLFFVAARSLDERTRRAIERLGSELPGIGLPAARAVTRDLRGGHSKWSSWC